MLFNAVGVKNSPYPMQSLGKLLQFFALVLLPLAAMLELTGALGREKPIADMLLMLLFGIACFGIGRIMEGYANR